VGFQDEPGVIRWRLHLRSPVAEVRRALLTARGRATFWAESAEEADGCIEFRILNYPPYRGRILGSSDDSFSVEYFGTVVTFRWETSPAGGTILTLHSAVEDEEMRAEMTAGWVSVLLALKAAVDFGVDLRNHDPDLSWAQGFADN
jgi:hypothetical protein